MDKREMALCNFGANLEIKLLYLDFGIIIFSRVSSDNLLSLLIKVRDQISIASG